MIIRTTGEVKTEEVSMEGVDKTYIQWIFSRKDDVPNFSMRRFTIKPGGKIPLHSHPWEHEMFFICGSGKAFTKTREADVGEGVAIYMPPDEPHGYRNDGDEDLVFLCLIPLSGDNN